jgi:Peptidase M50B-like
MGTISLGVCILISCALWVRNTWGLLVLTLEGLALVLLGWKTPHPLLGSSVQLPGHGMLPECIQDLFAVGDYYMGGKL